MIGRARAGLVPDARPLAQKVKIEHGPEDRQTDHSQGGGAEHHVQVIDMMWRRLYAGAWRADRMRPDSRGIRPLQGATPSGVRS